MENLKICYINLFLEVRERGDYIKGYRKEGIEIST
jgi:hypothetical protein